jgi:SAM-dependent methyltransferase
LHTIMLLNWVRQLRTRYWILPAIHRTYGALTVQQAFQKVYSSKIWGNNGTEFSSGAGSFGPASEEYCNAVVKFIHEHNVRSVVDLGCGDYSVGRRIMEMSRVQYIGVDVVPELIAHHQRNVIDPRVSFYCADIISDSLPSADLCLLRQVLQHLSNHEINCVLANIRSFPKVIVSEDVPARPRCFNRDKPHGPDVRAYFGSGVYLEQPPFCHPTTELWTFKLRSDALLRSVLIEAPESLNRSPQGNEHSMRSGVIGSRPLTPEPAFDPQSPSLAAQHCDLQ